MTPILSFPFRLAVDGTVAVVNQGSDQANGEQIGVLLGTIPGERDLQPGFGIPDPAFSGIQPGVVAAQVAMWGPNVKVKTVSAQGTGNETDVTVSFA
jgi:hypothetical protein